MFICQSTPAHAQPFLTQVKHSAEDLREKEKDVVAGMDRTAHKASVKGGRVLGERVPEKVWVVVDVRTFLQNNIGKDLGGTCKNSGIC